MLGKLLTLTALCALALAGCSESGTENNIIPETAPFKAGSVGRAGAFIDLDGDGPDDMLITAPGSGEPLAAGGFLVGREVAGSYAFAAARGTSRSEALGFSASDVGDVDGDGTPDYAIGALGGTGERSLSGRVDVYRGGTNPPELMAALKGGMPYDKFGYAVAGGDINGDGYSDVIASAIHATGQVFQAGAVYVFFGGPAIADTPDIVFEGHSANGGTGTAIATGDINGDGIDDLFYADHGTVLIYYGRASLAADVAAGAIANVSIFGKSVGGSGHSGSGFGDAMAFAGDVDGDGYGDIAIANPRRIYPDVSDNRGSVNIYRGGPALPASFYEGDPAYRITKIAGDDDAHRFGASVALVGDIDGGGKKDLLVGAIWAEGGASGTQKAAGRVYLFDMETLLDGTSAMYNTTNALRHFTADTSSGEFGAFLSAGPSGRFLTGAPLAGNGQGSFHIFDLATGGEIEIN